MANEPITRQEMLLNAVATGEAANLDPITRKEMFLAKLGGADVNTPTPITREEWFLQKAIENGGSGGGGGGSSADVRYVTFKSEDGSTTYGKKAVAVGDDCADPIARGVFDTPTKEPDAQYTYTSYGWATEPNGGADANWNKAVTEDRTVYAVFAASTRYYAVRFWNEDKLEQTVNVRYRENATYTAATPAKAGHTFTGWNPEPTNVTADMDCYAQFEIKKVFVSRELVQRTISGDYVNDRVTAIAEYAFNGCTALNGVNFPAVTSIGECAFNDCTALTTADFSVAPSVGISTFVGCTALTTVNFPAATSVGNGAFQRCSSLETVDFPAVISIDRYAFRNCSKLTTLILRNTTKVATLQDTNTFQSTKIASGTGYIYVPSALVDSYKSATNWSTYANQFRAIEDYPDICGGEA